VLHPPPSLALSLAADPVAPFKLARGALYLAGGQTCTLTLTLTSSCRAAG
jgi:hypothetical protein